MKNRDEKNNGRGSSQKIINTAIVIVVVLLIFVVGYLLCSNYSLIETSGLSFLNKESEHKDDDTANQKKETINQTKNTETSEAESSYSEEDLIDKAQLYYYVQNHAYPPVIEVDHYDGEDVVLHLYEYSSDGSMATIDWYTINKNTLKGTDFMGDNIDLNDLSVDYNYPNEYILPDSDSRYLSENDLYGLSAEECRLARNEIYARHGRMFDAEDLQQYFGNKSWYSPTYTPSEFKESWLNDYEVYNRDLIVKYEKEIE